MAENKQNTTPERRPDCVTEIRMGNTVLVVSGFFKKDTTDTAADKMMKVLEAEALPAQDALLLRAQNHPRPQCCACGGAQDLVSLGGRRWLCGACLAAANAASKA